MTKDAYGSDRLTKVENQLDVGNLTTGGTQMDWIGFTRIGTGNRFTLVRSHGFIPMQHAMKTVVTTLYRNGIRSS